MSEPTIAPVLWRDIASAPKKDRVLLWLSAPRLGENIWPGRMMLDSFTDRTGWYIETPLGMSEDAPTHWMPLPPPPIEAESAALNKPPRERIEAEADLLRAALCKIGRLGGHAGRMADAALALTAELRRTRSR